MLRVIGSYIGVTIAAIISTISVLIGVLPYYLMRLVGLKKLGERWLRWNGKMLARLVILVMGTRVVVEGKEHIPSDTKTLCIMSNHQGFWDIPVLFGYLPVSFGFVAKHSLARTPLVGTWCKALRCVFIDRKNPRSSIEAIKRGVASIEEGYPLAIFPEGTRSRSTHKIGTFKSGSTKLASRSHSMVIPVSIHGTAAIWEERRIRQSRVLALRIHPAIDTTKYVDDKEGSAQLSQDIQSVIVQGWEDLRSYYDK